MEFTVANLKGRKGADVIAIPFWKEKEKAKSAAEEGHLLGAVTDVPVNSGDFRGKEGEVLLIYATHLPEKRVALVGLGDKEKITTEMLRRSYAALVKACHARKIKSLHILVPTISGIGEEEIIRGVVEGIMLANYSFCRHKYETIKENPPVLLGKVTLIGAGKGALELAQKHAKICEGVHLARDLTNCNADDCTPQHLAELAHHYAKTLSHVKATVFDKKRIQKEKMGLLLAVNRGSHLDPAFIILEYKGNPKSKDHTIVIGKGITYDTGGLHLKTAGMDTMRADMGGAAVALATLKVAADLKLPINLTAVVPATENSISSTSYKMGDVYQGLTGKTVEVVDTDAEGRLVLADALAYAEKNLKPTRIIDFATLTGGMDIALGNEVTGLFSNDDALADKLVRAGSETYERVWRMPMFEEYKEALRSDIADTKNVATRSASSIMGATFLRSFLGNIPWAHLDIASTAFLNEHKRYHPKLATGIGVRLMIEFLQHI